MRTMASGMGFFRLCLQPCSSSSARFSFLDVGSNNNSSPFLTRKRVLLQHEKHRYRGIPPMRASRGGSATASANLKKSNAQSEESTKTGVMTRRAIVTLIALSTQAFAAASLSSRAEPTGANLCLSLSHTHTHNCVSRCVFSGTILTQRSVLQSLQSRS